MDKVFEIAKKLNAELKELPEIKEYLYLKSLYDKDKKVQSLIKKMDEPAIKQEEYDRLMKEYVANPLVNNYLQARQEAIDIINTIKDLIK